MRDWFATLHHICPAGHLPIIQGFAAAMPNCIEVASLSTWLRQAHFLAQWCEESDSLRATTEYASGHAYEGRHDLGNTHAGDGVRFKGRSLAMLTGRANYATYGQILGVDLISNPQSASEFPFAAKIPALYWKMRSINVHADADDIIRVTESVNGGLNGLQMRKQFLKLAKEALQ